MMYIKVLHQCHRGSWSFSRFLFSSSSHHHHPILIQVHLSNSHSPSRSIQGIFLQTSTLALLLHLPLLHLLWSSLLPLALHFKLWNAFLKTCPSSLLNTCLYHLTLFAFTIWTTVYFNPNISIRSSVLFFSISFVPHIALTIALSVLLKLLNNWQSKS